MEHRPSKREILYAFMLWYQEEYGRAASLAQMASYCPLWSGRQGAWHAVKALGKAGLAEQRTVNEPGQREHKKWWALEICSNCQERPQAENEFSLSLCQECYDEPAKQLAAITANE